MTKNCFYIDSIYFLSSNNCFHHILEEIKHLKVTVHSDVRMTGHLAVMPMSETIFLLQKYNLPFLLFVVFIL